MKENITVCGILVLIFLGGMQLQKGIDANKVKPQELHTTSEYKAGFHDGVLSGGRIMAHYLSTKLFWDGDGKPHRLSAGTLLYYANGQLDPTDTESDLVELYNMRTDELRKVLTKFNCWQKFDEKNKP